MYIPTLPILSTLMLLVPVTKSTIRSRPGVAFLINEPLTLGKTLRCTGSGVSGSGKDRRHRIGMYGRFLFDVIVQAVWLHFRFLFSLRMVKDLLAERGIIVSYQSVRTWVEKFGRAFAADIEPKSLSRFVSCTIPPVFNEFQG